MIADESGNKRQNKDESSLEQLAKTVYYDDYKLAKILPEKYKQDEIARKHREELSTHAYVRFYIDNKTLQAFNLANFEKNQKSIKAKVSTCLSDLKTANDKNKEILIQNLKIYIKNAVYLYEDFSQFYNLFNRYKQIYEMDKGIATDENTFVSNRASSIGAIPARFQQLVQVAADAGDISYDGSGILTIHYDERVNAITADPASSITASISEATASSQKIIIDGHLTAIVLFDNRLKVAKLGVWAFDSLQFLQRTLQEIVALASPADPNAGATLKASKMKKVNAVNAIAFNQGKINSSRSVKIIQGVIGAPQSGVFDALTVAMIYQWQKANTGKPKKADRGKLRDEDIEGMFKVLVTQIPDLAKPGYTKAAGQLDAIILLVMDYYDLAEAAMSLTEADFQPVGTAKGIATVKTADEMYMQMYYKEDADLSSKTEAAATYKSSGPLPAYILIGNSAYSSARDLASTIAHELLHARQDASDDSQPSQGAEMYAYLMETSRKFGSLELPKSTSLFTYADRIEVGTRKYYWELPLLEQKIAYRSVLQQYIVQGNKRTAEYVSSDYKQQIKEASNSNNTTTTSITTTTGPNTPATLSENQQAAIVMDEMLAILQKTISLMATIDTSTTGSVTVGKIDAIELIFTREFAASAWPFASTADFGADYKSLLTQTIGDKPNQISLTTYIDNFYRVNRDGGVAAITGPAITKMESWINANTVDPEKTTLMNAISSLRRAVV